MMHSAEVMRLCVRAWLYHIRHARLSMELLSDQIQRTNSQLELLGVSYDKDGGKATQTYGDDAITESIQHLEQWRDELAGNYEAIRDDLELVTRICAPDYPARIAVYLHDVDGLTWSECGRWVGYSEQSTRRIAEQGYAEIYVLMPEQWRRDPIPNAMPK